MQKIAFAHWNCHGWLWIKLGLYFYTTYCKYVQIRNTSNVQIEVISSYVGPFWEYVRFGLQNCWKIALIRSEIFAKLKFTHRHVNYYPLSICNNQYSTSDSLVGSVPCVTACCAISHMLMLNVNKQLDDSSNYYFTTLLYEALLYESFHCYFMFRKFTQSFSRWDLFFVIIILNI